MVQLAYEESQALDRIMYEEEVRREALAFEQQFHYGIFYAYMRLREQARAEAASALCGSSSLLHIRAEAWIQASHDPKS